MRVAAMASPFTPSQQPSAEGPLRILFCANPAYFQHVAVAAVSLAENNRHSVIDVHLVTCDRDAAAEEMLRASFADYCSLVLTIHDAPAERVANLFVDEHVSKETYLRILAPELLPSQIDRIIYLDSDVVVLDDLRPLWTINLEHKALAAAPDYPQVPIVLEPARRAALGIPQDWTYVNAGVLLIDLSRWRRERLTQQLLKYIRHHGRSLELWDQDAVNAVLHDAIRHLDCRWNLQARIYRAGRRSFPMEFAATREARRRPAILHFSTREKPWLFRSLTARKNDYFRYLDKTAWRDAGPDLTTTIQLVEYRAGRLLSRAGIDYLHVINKTGRALSKLGVCVVALAHRILNSIRRPGFS